MSLPFTPSCNNRTMLAMAYGAVSSFVGIDRMLPMPREVVWATAGLGADYQCRGFNADQHLALCMAGGFGGGFVVSMLMS